MRKERLSGKILADLAFLTPLSTDPVATRMIFEICCHNSKVCVLFSNLNHWYPWLHTYLLPYKSFLKTQLFRVTLPKQTLSVPGVCYAHTIRNGKLFGVWYAHTIRNGKIIRCVCTHLGNYFIQSTVYLQR